MNQTRKVINNNEQTRRIYFNILKAMLKDQGNENTTS